VVGLAYNQVGGATLYIESVFTAQANEQGRGGIRVTGQLGDVMKESSAIAYTFAKNFLKLNGSDEALKKLEGREVHIHFPEGATPKDGPSAGITITSALVSLALDKKVPAHIGMTGEISLTGKVLPIGGVKEKTMGAVREGITELIFPEENRKDVEDLPDYIKKDVKKFHFAKEYADVFKVIFN